jgi:hypothetical protein
MRGKCGQHPDARCIRDCLKKKGEVMPERVKKEDFIRQLAVRMNADDGTAAAWIDGMVETLYESFKAGKGVTLPGFGGFCVRPEPESWVFRFNPGQRLRALFGWSSTYTGQR